MTTAITVSVPASASYKAVVQIVDEIGETEVSPSGISIVNIDSIVDIVRPGKQMTYNIWGKKRIEVYETPLDQQVIHNGETYV